jgi:hypothetical protein
MALTQADLDRLAINIAAGNTWVEGDETADGTDAAGGQFKSISKINNEAELALAAQAMLVPIPYAGAISFTASETTKTVEEVGVIYAPKPSALPFTTSGTFIGDDDARFYVIQNGSAAGISATPTAPVTGVNVQAQLTEISSLLRTYKNLIINGGFDVWQRGVAFTGIEFTADRWKSFVAVNVDRSTTAPDGSAYSAAIGPLGSLRTQIELPATGDPGAFILGRVFTFSMMVKSASASIVGVSIRFIDGSAGGNPTPTTAILSSEPTTTGWTKVSGSIAIPDAPNASNTCLQVVIDTTVATNIAQVQLEEGTVATDFEYRPIAEELALCQRYYIRYTRDIAVPTAITLAMAQCTSTTDAEGSMTFPVELRGTPSLGWSSASAVNATAAAGSGIAGTGVTLGASGTLAAELLVTVGSGLVAGNASSLILATNSWIDFDAEL